VETFGKSGCRRIVPGQFLATDPKGRAVMIAAVEKQKFVYVFNRDASANLTISSPLEAHKSNTVPSPFSNLPSLSLSSPKTTRQLYATKQIHAP
jgi:hypothetical protein